MKLAPENVELINLSGKANKSENLQAQPSHLPRMPISLSLKAVQCPNRAYADNTGLVFWQESGVGYGGLGSGD